MNDSIRHILRILADKSAGFMCELPYTIAHIDELNCDNSVKENCEDYKYLYNSAGSYFISYLADNDITPFYEMGDEYLNYYKNKNYTLQSINSIIDDTLTYVYDTRLMANPTISHFYILEHYFDIDMLRICIQYSKGLVLIDPVADDLDIPLLDHPKYAGIAKEIAHGYNPMMHRIMRGGTLFKRIWGLEYVNLCNNLREYIKLNEI